MSRTIITCGALALGALALAAAAPSAAAAQEPGQAITLTGCLAQEEDDDGVEYLLQHVDPAATTATEIELVPEPELDLAPHVGHQVEITGVVIADDEDDAEEVEEDEPEDEDENELHIRVSGMRHIAATCGGG